MKCWTVWVLKAGVKIAGRNINNLRYVNDTTLMTESEEGLESLLMSVKEESEKAGLKLNIKKANIMTSGLITYIVNRRGKGGSGDRFPLLGVQNHCGW